MSPRVIKGVFYGVAVLLAAIFVWLLLRDLDGKWVTYGGLGTLMVLLSLARAFVTADADEISFQWQRQKRRLPLVSKALLYLMVAGVVAVNVSQLVVLSMGGADRGASQRAISVLTMSTILILYLYARNLKTKKLEFQKNILHEMKGITGETLAALLLA